MKIPSFPECNHPLVQQLGSLSDRELVRQFQAEPDVGKYFTAIFCRYSPVVYTLISHSVRSPVQAEYLFAQTWRHILNELGGLTLPPETAGGLSDQMPARSLTLQSWLINVTALCINQARLPDVEDVHYSLAEAPPPLWCYVTRALNQLAPLERLILIMSQTFRWSHTRISAYLRAEGERVSPAEIEAKLRQASAALEAALPDDIRTLYLTQINAGILPTPVSPATGMGPELMPTAPGEN